MEQISFSPKVFADRHGLSRSFVYALIGRGEIRAVKIGTATRITRDDEAAWLRSLPSIGADKEARDDA